jgi:hypothetical protein
MPLEFAMSVMSAVEFALWATLGIIFWSKGLHRRFPAISFYLALRVSSTPVLLGLLYLQAQPWGHGYFPFYFYTFWGAYIASAVTLFFVTLEVFRSVLASFSGLLRLGTIVFRWVALVAMIASLGTVSYSHISVMLIPDVAYALMRSVSILELCLLGFLCLCINTLRLSTRDIGFGTALALGVMSANDFLHSVLTNPQLGLNATLQFAYEGAILLSLGIWVAYCALPEPVRKPVVVPANSTIYRWNEIAAALGHGTQIAVQQPANSFFLTDVERVVEKVLKRNLQGNESQ